MAKKITAGGKKKATEDDPAPPPDPAAQSAHQAQMNQARRLAQPRQPTEQPREPPAPRVPTVPPAPNERPPHKPMVGIEGRLQLEGHWNLQCYEYKYVTEHLQLHRFPIDRQEKPEESEPAEEVKAVEVEIVNGVVQNRQAEPPVESGGEPKGKEKEVAGDDEAEADGAPAGDEAEEASHEPVSEPQVDGTSEEISQCRGPLEKSLSELFKKLEKPDVGSSVGFQDDPFAKTNPETGEEDTAARDLHRSSGNRIVFIEKLRGAREQSSAVSAARDTSVKAGVKFSGVPSDVFGGGSGGAVSEALSRPPSRQHFRDQFDEDYDISSEESPDEDAEESPVQKRKEPRRSVLSVSEMCNDEAEEEEKPPAKTKRMFRIPTFSRGEVHADRDPSGTKSHKDSPKRKFSSVSENASDYYKTWPESDESGRSVGEADHRKREPTPEFDEDVFDGSPAKRRRVSSPVPPEEMTGRTKKGVEEVAELDVAQDESPKKGKQARGAAAKGRGGKGKGRGK
ncbi:hypothetical protein PRZ48_000466 [Zasmidium cellare]|uniref:Uncharacterized protein n=1 Tax=Zasmidium cellare TaxID=395010 RepID=A0ABR0EZU0_ZASCE|nr:hypothetical protein PRZ48_000466 [Zasmidium cellare]